MNLQPLTQTIDYFGRELKLQMFEGVVQEEATHSNARIESQRNLHGNVANVYSVQETSQALWLKASDGREVRVEIGGLSVPVRAGHVVRAFYCSSSQTDQPTLIGIKNINTGEYVSTANKHQQLPPLKRSELPAYRAYGPFLIFPALVVVCGLLAYVLNINFFVIFWILMPVTFFWLFRQMTAFDRKIQGILDRIRDVVQTA